MRKHHEKRKRKLRAGKKQQNRRKKIARGEKPSQKKKKIARAEIKISHSISPQQYRNWPVFHSSHYIKESIAYVYVESHEELLKVEFTG